MLNRIETENTHLQIWKLLHKMELTRWDQRWFKAALPGSNQRVMNLKPISGSNTVPATQD